MWMSVLKILVKTMECVPILLEVITVHAQKDGKDKTVIKVHINECEDQVCKNGGNCTNTEGSYNCTCVEGYQGKNCDESESAAILDQGNFFKERNASFGDFKNVFWSRMHDLFIG
ncbi:hypothetical protein QZH41_012187 [Actinostola sp. cb2023]|nr:hypothetical protein QZH41_012187 [Actinostola sp. cb2023]